MRRRPRFLTDVYTSDIKSARRIDIINSENITVDFGLHLNNSLNEHLLFHVSLHPENMRGPKRPYTKKHAALDNITGYREGNTSTGMIICLLSRSYKYEY